MRRSKHDNDQNSGAATADAAATSLAELRQYGGERQTEGIALAELEPFLGEGSELSVAIELAVATHRGLRAEYDELLQLPEDRLCRVVQERYLNFYAPESVMPYLPVSARGPWIVTSHGAVLHDSAGYGMLGLGHAGPELLETLSAPWPMANVMTPSISQHRFAERLQREIGHSRDDQPFSRFVCLNSGSEAVTVAARIADVNARRMTGVGGKHEGKTIRALTLEGSFHGRTFRAARVSHSTQALYREHLASFHDHDAYLEVVPPNDCGALRRAFEEAELNGIFFEAVFLEPVLGEGRPGEALTREFYDLARTLSAKTGTLLIVDSIQAALRAHGCLSVVDYPGFQDCAPPDVETYSKALNAGQFPLSVLALRGVAAERYVIGIYGNTMTTNPRALELGCAVLDAIDDELRRNIRERGEELLRGLRVLGEEFPGAITALQGTGLLLAAELNPEHYQVVGHDGFEQFLRKAGIVMIHAGQNAIRFTPHFRIGSAEIDLILKQVRRGLIELRKD